MDLWTALSSITPDLRLYYLALFGPGILGVLLAGFAVSAPGAAGLKAALAAVVGLTGILIAAPQAKDHAYTTIPELRKEAIATYLAEEHHLTAAPIKVRDHGASALGFDADGTQWSIELEWAPLSTNPDDPAADAPNNGEPLTLTIEPTQQQRTPPDTNPANDTHLAPPRTRRPPDLPGAPEMTTSPTTPAPKHINGIVLDADSIRAELTESPQTHDLTPASAQTILEMSDDDLNAALQEAVDDTFWEIYDNTRSRAIASLATAQLNATPDPAGA